MKSSMTNLVLNWKAPCILMVIIISAEQAIMSRPASTASTSLLTLQAAVHDAPLVGEVVALDQAWHYTFIIISSDNGWVGKENL